MATLTHLDTHVLVWAVSPESHHRLSPSARRSLEDDTLRVSPMVTLELAYLHEIGRLEHSSHQVMARAELRLEARVASEPFAAVVEEAMAMGWTQDPFDRLIAAQATAAGARLLTRDETIRENVDRAFW